MNTVTWLYPAPGCPLPITHPARAHSDDVDLERTWSHYSLLDDYDLTSATDYLEVEGAMK